MMEIIYFYLVICECWLGREDAAALAHSPLVDIKEDDTNLDLAVLGPFARLEVLDDDVACLLHVFLYFY